MTPLEIAEQLARPHDANHCYHGPTAPCTCGRDGEVRRIAEVIEGERRKYDETCVYFSRANDRIASLEAEIASLREENERLREEVTQHRSARAQRTREKLDR